MKLKNKIVLLVLSLVLISCSSVDKAPDHHFREDIRKSYNLEENQKRDINEELAILYGIDDPLGPLNRRIYYFNGMADRYVLKPAVTTYKYYTPNFFQKRVSNFFTNFGNITTALNSFLQLKFTQGVETAVRFGLNSTVGLLGLFDPASKIGIPQYKENLGMTLAYYGVGRGPYVVIPLMGPSNLRDAAALAVNGYVVDKMDVYHPVNIDFGELYMLALYGFSTKVDSGIYFLDSDYVFEYEYMRFLSKKYNDLLEKKNKHRAVKAEREKQKGTE